MLEAYHRSENSYVGKACDVRRCGFRLTASRKISLGLLWVRIRNQE